MGRKEGCALFFFSENPHYPQNVECMSLQLLGTNCTNDFSRILAEEAFPRLKTLMAKGQLNDANNSITAG